MSKAQTGVVNIRGREYTTVAKRVQDFRERHPEWTLQTDIIHRDVDCVVMRATISDELGRVRANGHAEEYRKASEINRTSALENCETSAIGRALAALGFGGTEFASADEVARAVSGQKGEPVAHSGPALAFAELQPEIQNKLRQIAQHVVDTMPDVARAISLIEMACDEWPDNDLIKPGLWSLLDSGTRSAIKRHQAEKEAA